MLCENTFCIYYSDHNCLRDDITLDIEGRCMQCRYVTIDEENLEKLRAKMREERRIFDLYYSEIM